MATKTRICKDCGDPILKGQSDKKYCNSTCRDNYNNRFKVEENGEVNRIINVLKNNRRVLMKLFNKKKPDKIFNREALIKAGFEFGFSSHTVITKTKSNEIIFCLDYGYKEITTGHFQIYPSFSKVYVKDNGTFVVNES